MNSFPYTIDIHSFYVVCFTKEVKISISDKYVTSM